MAEKFNRPTDVLSIQDNFSEREVGVTHPDVASYVRLNDNGDIEIITGEGLGLVMNKKTRTITFLADNVRVLTKEQDGFRWNNLAFNHKATTFNEPTFLALDPTDTHNLYRDTDVFFGNS